MPRILVTVLPFAMACAGAASCLPSTGGAATSPDCVRVEGRGWGPAGTEKVEAQVVVEGLEVPWALGFLPGGDVLVTERPGRLRLVKDGALVSKPLATLEVARSGEGGLLGLAVDPDFAANRLVYLYLTARSGGDALNRIERWKLSEDHLSATLDKVLLADIPSASVHDGGRLRFGPDGMLYAGTGDARTPSDSRDRKKLAGKILRLTRDGGIPADNPFPGSYVFASGLRNTQGFDWRDGTTLYVVDHGPSGDTGRSGADEINVVKAGDDLGWPEIFSCETRDGLVTPSLTFERAAPPGGAAIYRGTRIAGWKDALVVGTLGSRHLHLVRFATGTRRVERHEVYFQGDPPSGLRRLREVQMGPDGELYVTTSNCDGRGTCPASKDRVLRIVPASP